MKNTIDCAIGCWVDAMKVVYIVSLFPCWSETFIVREINALIALGVDVQIVSLKHAHESLVQNDARQLLDRVVYPKPLLSGSLLSLLEMVRRPLCSIRDLTRIFTGLGASGSRIAKSLVVWWRTLALSGTVRELNPDRMHAHWATYPAAAAQALSGRLGVPFGFTCHAHDIFVERQFIASKLRSADVAVTISEFNVGFLGDRIGSDLVQKLSVIHCGVVPGDYPYQSTGRDLQLIVSVGRLDSIKGFETLIQACSELLSRQPTIRCVIVGEGPLRSKFENQISRLGLSSVVQLVGSKPTEAVRDLMAVAGAFVLPCRVTGGGDRDGIPVALMEAMACGAPVVSTTVSGIPELITSEAHGLLVAPDDPKGLASAIDRQLSDTHAAAEMAQRARARIERDFDVATESAKLLALFESAAQPQLPLARLANG